MKIFPFSNWDQGHIKFSDIVGTGMQNQQKEQNKSKRQKQRTQKEKKKENKTKAYLQLVKEIVGMHSWKRIH